MTGATHQYDLDIFQIVLRVLVELEVAVFAPGAFGKVENDLGKGASARAIAIGGRPGLALDADAAVGDGLGDLVCVDGLEPYVSVERVVSLFGDGSSVVVGKFLYMRCWGSHGKEVGVERGERRTKERHWYWPWRTRPQMKHSKWRVASDLLSTESGVGILVLASDLSNVVNRLIVDVIGVDNLQGIKCQL